MRFPDYADSVLTKSFNFVDDFVDDFLEKPLCNAQNTFAP